MADEKPVTSPGLQLQPIVHVVDMASAVAFYEHLGAEIIHGGRDDDWTLLQLSTTQIGLLLADTASSQQSQWPAVELNFSTPMPLDRLEQRLRRAGVTIADTATPTAFGVQLQVRSPDGLLIKINQRESDRYE